MNRLVSPEIVGDKIPILCNQENFILKANSYKLFQAIPGFQFFINPAIKPLQDRGRPSNGMFICVPESIKSCVTDVSPGHWRVQAVVIASEHSRTLLINSYFPFDKRNQLDNEGLTELIETLGVISNIIQSSNCDSVVWTGDINTDYSRVTPHCTVVREHVEQMSLARVWDNYEVDFTCTYEREGVSFTSTLDQFYLSERILPTVVDAGVIHHPENTSDHEPIYCVLKSITVIQNAAQPSAGQPRPSWRLADQLEKEHYKLTLEAELGAIVIPTQILECQDTHCKQEEHIEAIDWFTTETLEAVQRAGEKTLPFPKAGKAGKKCTPGFDERVKPHKETAYFWHNVWKSAGRPMNNQVHQIMKRTRNRYHMELKKCQKAEKIIKKTKLLNACLNGDGDLFDEIKKMRKTKVVVADKIDGVTKEIPNHFGNIYEELFNSVKDGEEVKLITEEVDRKITVESLSDVNKVTIEEVKKAAAALKSGKGDPVYSFSSDCLKVESNILSDYTAVIIRSFLLHNYIPQFMLISTLVPIIKDKLGSINLSKNYRSVCITSLILKQFDWIVISLFGEALGFHDLQFAYQPGVSANMCSWAVIETVSYFLRNGSDVFGCSMDKSKAFDVCKFSVLFKKMSIKLSPIFLRLIIHMYVNQFSNVRFGGEVSASFSISNGVGQGKILAGFAYCYYCYEFFDILKNSGYGCFVNNVYAGVYGYSDDDFLLAPSHSALSAMINLAELYFSSHGLKFSTDPDPRKSKTKCIAWLQQPRPLAPIELCGRQLPWVDKVVHLGMTLTNTRDIINSDMNIKKARYVARNIELNQEFSFATSETKLKINELYNSSWFGSVMYKLYGPEAVKLESCYNRSVKIMMDLPFATHRGLIEPLARRRHLRKSLSQRFVVMTEKIKKSKKPILHVLLSEIERDVRSNTGCNLRMIMIHTNKSDISQILPSDIESLPYFNLAEDEEWRVEMLRHLLDERERSPLDNEDLEWLDYLCCD